MESTTPVKDDPVKKSTTNPPPPRPPGAKRKRIGQVPVDIEEHKATGEPEATPPKEPGT